MCLNLSAVAVYIVAAVVYIAVVVVQIAAAAVVVAVEFYKHLVVAVEECIVTDKLLADAGDSSNFEHLQLMELKLLLESR